MEQAPFPDRSEPVRVFRLLEAGDLDRITELAEEFFAESELASFATFDPGAIRATFEGTLSQDDFVAIVFAPEGQVEGFIAFQLEASYTVEPLALGYLFYVSPKYRRSPAGRHLQQLAVNYAKEAGAVAFYNGVMAGMESVSKTLPNLYRKMGFEPLWWGRKILTEG